MRFRTLPAETRRVASTTMRRPIPVWAAVAGILLALVVGGAVYGLLRLPKAPAPDIPATGDRDPPPVLDETVERQLLELHTPVIYLAPGERWQPIPVSEFLRDACLSRRNGALWTRCSQAPGVAESELPRGADVRLDVAVCVIGEGPECYQNDALAHELPRGAVYGRLWRNTTGQDTATAYVAQYWIFYYFNDWQNGPRRPTAWQFHEGDWESITIGLSRDLNRVFAAYSQHCTGSIRPWEKVEKRPDSAAGEETHPVVYVARGSHANFFEPGVHPGEPKCLPTALRPIRNRLNHVDVAGADRSFGVTAKLPLDLVMLDDVPWRPFQGNWGEGEFVRFVNNLGRRETRRGGQSPRGPAQHGELWLDPISLFLKEWTTK